MCTCACTCVCVCVRVHVRVCVCVREPVTSNFNSSPALLEPFLSDDESTTDRSIEGTVNILCARTYVGMVHIHVHTQDIAS